MPGLHLPRRMAANSCVMRSILAGQAELMHAHLGGKSRVRNIACQRLLRASELPGAYEGQLRGKGARVHWVQHRRRIDALDLEFIRSGRITVRAEIEKLPGID